MALEELPDPGSTDWYGWAAQTDTFARRPRTNPLSELAPEKLYVAKVEGVNVASGAEYTLLDVTGPGFVESLWMAIGGGNNPCLDGRLRVFYDGSATPAIDIDIGTLLAGHYGAGVVNGPHSTVHTHMEIAANAANIGFLLTFPMPFGTSIKVTYLNVAGTTQIAGIYSMLAYRLTPVDYAAGLRLRCAGARLIGQAIARTAGSVTTLLSTTGGPGSIVYHSQVGGVGAVNMTWLERNFRIRVDGETTAAIEATGTEDWYDSAWYFFGWKDYNAGFHSYVGTDAPSGNPYVVGMVTDLLSKWGGVPFESSVVMTAEAEPACTTGDTFSYAVLYYSVA